jgi:hypothetical protein
MIYAWVYPAYSLFGCTPGLSRSRKEKSPKAYEKENEEATQLVLLILFFIMGNYIQRITGKVN